MAGPIINAGTAYEVAGPVGYITVERAVLCGARLLPGTRRTAAIRPATRSPEKAGRWTRRPPTWPQAGTRTGAWPTSTTSIAYAFEVGTYGAQFKIYPGGGNALAGLTNNYTDVAEDFQFQFIGEKNTATLKGTYVRENQSLNATGPAGLGTTNADDWVSYLSTDFTYWYKRKYGFTAGLHLDPGIDGPAGVSIGAPRTCLRPTARRADPTRVRTTALAVGVDQQRQRRSHDQCVGRRADVCALAEREVRVAVHALHDVQWRVDQL